MNLPINPLPEMFRRADELSADSVDLDAADDE